MKILWFANTPCGASEKLMPNLNVGGWLSSLEKQLVKSPNVSLSIAFYWEESHPPFELNSVCYYPIKRTLASKVRNKFKYITDDEQEIKSCIKIIDEVNPDIIHVHGTEENFGLIQKYVNIPVLVSIQGLLAPYAEKFFSGIPKSVVQKRESFKNILTKATYNDDFRRILLRAQREKEILSLSTNIMGRTVWDKNIASFLAPDSRYFVGEEILRSDFYAESDMDKKNYYPNIILTSIISGGLYKGLETLFKCAKLLKEQGQAKYIWNIIGLSEESKYAQLVIKWLNIVPSDYGIYFLGNKNETEIIHYFNMTDMYIHVSHIENSPNSVCEAMLFGLPVIASYAGGTSSLIQDGIDGKLYQDGEIYNLASLINKLKENKNNELQYLAQNARKNALRKHNPNTIVLSLLNTYQQILIERTQN